MSKILEQIFNKKEITLVVTDSGLGGVSIAADIMERIKNAGIFSKVSIIFFNASFDNKSGYNKIKSNKEKVRILNCALNSIYQNYKPDLLLIGCNTLSVIYSETSFSQKTTTNVIGIVEAGVDIIMEKLSSDPQANVIIFATNTTIAKGSHKKILIERGVKPENIISISCSELVNKIEEGYQSKETRTLVNQCVNEAITKIKDRDIPLIVSLNCTHYGYVLHLFKHEFEMNGIKPLAVLNPNPRMSDFIFQSDKYNRFKKPAITIEVVSKVTISHGVMKSICELIGLISPQTVLALKNYKHDKNLF